ncbi:MAG: hypothetical protein ABSD98_04185 [Candidatus Korobacteraceae bacterium]|jgi:hypothetical protein
MKPYTKVNVSEQRLEDLVRRNPGSIEEGLVYVDHQKRAAGGRLDVLLVDSGKSLVVAELKVVEDDGMLVQGLDYYDYVSTNIESFARLYNPQLKASSTEIDPTEPVRLFLIAPDFSNTLVNRCKWLNLPISLFTFSCLKFEDDEDLVPIFLEREVPTLTEPPEVRPPEDILGYITDPGVRTKVNSLLDEVKNWNPGHVTQDATKYAISIKINNRVFAYLWPRRKHYVIGTYGSDDEWKEYPVKGDEDLVNVKTIMKEAMERREKTTAAIGVGAGN